jgi:hypothetical protein
VYVCLYCVLCVMCYVPCVSLLCASTPGQTIACLLSIMCYVHVCLYYVLCVMCVSIMCFNSRSDNRLPPLYYGGTQLSYTDTFKYLGKEMPLNLQLELNMYRS